MANANTHTKGTPSWARVHLANVPADCAGVKDCPDCKSANDMVALVEKKDREVGITRSTEQAQGIGEAITQALGEKELKPGTRKSPL